MSDVDSARWAKIAAALTTPEMHKQVQTWEVERLTMLTIVSLFWNSEAANFRKYVQDTANSVEISAIVLTSMEDMPEVRVLSFASKFCLSPRICTDSLMLPLGIHWRSHGCCLPGTIGSRSACWTHVGTQIFLPQFHFGHSSCHYACAGSSLTFLGHN